MARELRLQDPGEGIHEATIQDILVGVGDHVDEGDMVLVVETDKAAVEVPSPYTGEIGEIAVGKGDQVRVGDVLMRFADGEEEAAPAAAPEPQSEPEPEPEAEPEPEPEPEDEAETQPAPPSSQARAEADTGERAPSRHPGGPVPATPSTRRVARELGVDLAEVKASGRHGRVTEDDVRRHAGEGRKDGGGERPRESSEERVVELGPVKRATARQMARAWAEIPHVAHHDEVDITALERFRREHEAAIEGQGGKLTVTAFAMKAAAVALREHPTFNARFDAEREVLRVPEAVHLGVALDSERGLIVPVVRDVQRKSVAEIAVEVFALGERLREEAPAPDELEGATFTVTNVGALGGTGFTPIVNPPQVAILGLAKAALRSVVTGDLEAPETAVRLVLPIVVAFDHRANDGADAARFTNRIAELLHGPDALALYG